MKKYLVVFLIFVLTLVVIGDLGRNRLQASGTIYEAESATFSNAVISTDQPGYTGIGFVNTTNIAGPYVEWSINVVSSDDYDLRFRYGNGSTNNRDAELEVNSTVIDSSMDFVSTSTFDNWQMSTKTVALTSGTNTIRLTANHSEGLTNIDHLELELDDTTAPSNVTDLSANAISSTSIDLSWTAPGDDGVTGTATSYDIRYNPSTIGSWASATQVSGEPSPSAGGSSESMTINGLSANTTYYFAIKTTDDASNVSGLSNITNDMTDASGPLKAFPGAEGFGKYTRGAYALYEQTNDPDDFPVIMKVTNLNDSGSGSLRSCVEASGPRVCLVWVDGAISLSNNIVVNHPYLTIAGQTSPGDGIVLKDKTFILTASEVIIRNMRFRLGSGGASTDDSMAIRAPSASINNVIIDHSSISWGRDENTGVNAGILAPYTIEDVTFMRSLIYEGFTPHSMGLLLNAPNGWDTIRNVSVIGNLLANNNGRYPNIGGNGAALEVEVINNIAYQWDSKGADVKDDSTVHFIENIYKPGPNTRGLGRAIELNNNSYKVYVKGNDATINSSISNPPPVVDGDNGGSMLFTPSGYIDVDITQLDTVVGDRAGAFPRDDADARIVYEYLNDLGDHIANETEVGGYPTLAAGTPPTDTDDDGMPDSWEIANSLDENDPDDANEDSGDGYSNLEVYLNSFFDSDGSYTN